MNPETGTSVTIRQYKCPGNVKNSFSADFLSAARDKIEKKFSPNFRQLTAAFTRSAWPFGQDGLIEIAVENLEKMSIFPALLCNRRRQPEVKFTVTTSYVFCFISDF